MKILIFFIIAIFSFSYELAVSNEFDKNKLEDFGFICTKKENLYVCLSSNNIKDLMKIKDFLKSKFNIDSKIIDNNSLKKTFIIQKGFCIQVGSFKNFENAKRLFKKYKTLPFARIEKRGNFYRVEIGNDKNSNKIMNLAKKTGGIVKECSLEPQRIILANFNYKNLFNNKCNDNIQKGFKLIDIFPTMSLIYFNKALKCDSTNEKAFLGKALVYINLKNYKKAENILLNLHNQHPNNKEILIALGDLYFRENQLDRAVDFYKKSLNIYPNDLSVLRKIELIYVKKEDCKNAVKYADKIIYLQFKNKKLK